MQKQNVYIVRIQLFIKLLQKIFAERLIPRFYILSIFIGTSQVPRQVYLVPDSL